LFTQSKYCAEEACVCVCVRARARVAGYSVVMEFLDGINK